MCKKKSGKGRARDHFAEASSVDTLLPPFLPLPHMLPKFVCRLLSLLLPMPYQPMLVLVCPMAPEPLEGDPVQTDRQIDGPFRVNGCILWMNSHNQFLELGVTSPHHGLLSVCISAAREGGGREGVKCRGWHTAAATAAGKSGGHHHTRQGPMQGPPQGQGGLLGPSQRCHKCAQ